MKIIFTSDWHLLNDNPVGRLDNVVDTQWDKLGFIFTYAKMNGVGLILQAGDMTDIKRSWELLQMLSEFLTEFPSINLLMVKGQHDSYYHDMQNKKTIVGVLESSKLLTVLDEDPEMCSDEIAIYGASYGENVPKVVTPEALNILVIHKQILVNKIFEGQKDYESASTFLKENPDYDLILCGDVHQRFEKRLGNRIICNTGPLLRLEATSAMMAHKPGFYVFNSDGHTSLEWVEIPSSDGSKILSRDHLERQKKKDISFESFISRVQESADETKTVSFDKNLEIVMKKNKSSQTVRSLVTRYLAEDNPKEK